MVEITFHTFCFLWNRENFLTIEEIKYYKCFCLFVIKHIFFASEPDAAELGANTDANYTCTIFFWNIFWQILFFLMLTKEYIFVLGNSQILHNSKFKTTFQLFIYVGPMSTLVEPNQMILGSTEAAIPLLKVR